MSETPTPPGSKLVEALSRRATKFAKNEDAFRADVKDTIKAAFVELGDAHQDLGGYIIQLAQNRTADTDYLWM